MQVILDVEIGGEILVFPKIPLPIVANLLTH